MIIGFLICIIGLIPIVLGISMKNIYNELHLSNILTIYMIFLAIWQFDVGILYFQDILNENISLIGFKLLRFGPTCSIPIDYYVAYIVLKNQPLMIKENKWFSRFLAILLNRKILWLVIIWSFSIYIINWTTLGIKGVELRHSTISSMSYYWPVYGPLKWLYWFHEASFILFLLLVFVVSGKILNSHVKNFLRRFSIYSLFLFVFGLLNFSPKVGGIPGSIGVIIFSTLIVQEFMKLSSNLKANYYVLMERQKKLDHTGNIAASLIHEVKNTNQIINGFSNMLMKSKSLTEQDKSLLEMIHKASVYFEDLANNYRDYMKSNKMTLKKEDIEFIIQQSIAFSKGLIEKHQVEIELVNPYNSLIAYVNKTSLEQVFINLIKNSIESIPENNQVKKITIKTELDDDNIIIHFFDTGRGLSPENWDTVFDPFISTKSEGMGLGLPYIKKIIIEHFGNIQIVESTSKGTHFRIELPQNGIFDDKKIGRR